MIGYYVHHQGRGHLGRMLSVTRHLDTPVTVLSSLSPPAGCELPWVRLSRDDEGGAVADADAGGTLHWAPRHDDGLRERSLQIVRWVAQERPTLVVVDVSVEVTLLVRLTGTPVVVAAMPGARTDRPHRTAYDAADALLAPWPRGLGVERWPAEWSAKTHYVGAIGRFDDRTAPDRPAPDRTGAGRRGLLLWGFGGGAPTDVQLEGLRAATAGWTWEVAGAGAVRSQDEIWSALGRADLVVAHGGQNSLAEIGAARVPAVLVAAPRPFDEQAHTVRALDRAGIAVGLMEWPDADRWPALVERAQDLGGDGWRRWTSGDGAQRAAAALVSHVQQLGGTAGLAPVGTG